MQSFEWNQILSAHPYLIEIAIVSVLVLVSNFVFKRFLKRAKAKSDSEEKRRWIFLDAVILRPIQAILWIVFIFFLLQLPIKIFKLEGSFAFIPILRDAGIIICIGWLCLRWKTAFYQSVLEKRAKGKIALDPASMELVNKLFTIAVIFLTLILFMQALGVNVVPLITFGGIGAAAIGFASKDVFANFFGGLMLNLTRPFSLNDLIELPEKKIMGHVETVGWYLTVLRDMQKKPIYVPNSVFSSELVINQSRMTHRRIEETIGLKFSDFEKCQQIVEAVRHLFDSHAEIDHRLPINVYARTLAAAGIELEVNAYTVTTRYDEFMVLKQKILLDICRLVEEQSNGFSNPTICVETRNIAESK